MQQAAEESTKNIVLQSLPDETYRKILPSLEFMEMPLGQKIYQPDERITYIYFPETSVISIVTYLENGNCIETGIIGRDGLSGTEVLLARDYSPREAVVQCAGYGRRMTVENFKAFCETDGNFSQSVLRYIYSFIGQISQNPACLSFHSVEKRLARWLLMFQDRVGGDELKLTQEFIAVMLGVHRPSVSKCAARLQAQGLIDYNRGLIKILNREGLLTTSCECYQAINRATDVVRE